MTVEDLKIIIQNVYKNTKGIAFENEKEFQYKVAQEIESKYKDKNVIVLMESIPFNLFSIKDEENMHVDIIVILNNKMIPIELKFKKKSQKAETDNRFLYLNDISRIEKIRDKYYDRYLTGYAIFLTDNEKYIISGDENNKYKYPEFSIKQGRKIIKPIELTNDRYNIKPTINGNYEFDWFMYSDKLIKSEQFINENNKNDNLFYLISEIKK